MTEPTWTDWPEATGLHVMMPSHIRSASDLVRVTVRHETNLCFSVPPFDGSWGATIGQQYRWYGPIPEDEK